MNYGAFYINRLVCLLLVFMSSVEIMGQNKETNSFLYLEDAERITYKQVAFSKEVFMANECLDLRDIEFDGASISASFHSEADSLFLGIFDNDLRWYVVSNGKMACHKVETPLVKIKYNVPKLAVIKQNHWASGVKQEYEAEGLYSGKDSMKIVGCISFGKKQMNSIFLPSLDTLKNIYVVNRKDNYWVRYISKETSTLNVIDNTDFYYAYGFEYPIFVSSEKRILQQGTVVSESKRKYYFEVEPFVHSIKSNQESLVWKSVSAKDAEQADEMLARYDVSCTDKKMNVSFMLRKDGKVKVLVANVLGMVYVSREVEAKSNNLQSLNINLDSYPSGRYIVYLNVMGKNYSRTINN